MTTRDDEVTEWALVSLPGFEGRAPARTWLLSIARRVVVDQVRRARRSSASWSCRCCWTG